MANRYNSIPLKSSQGTPNKFPTAIYQTVKYPEIPLSVNDTYAITTLGDRLDLLAQQFYGDSSLYWIIACANPDKIGFSSLFINEGTEIRIPSNVSQIKALYNQLNTV
jgi:hypothetical protein